MDPESLAILQTFVWWRASLFPSTQQIITETSRLVPLIYEQYTRKASRQQGHQKDRFRGTQQTVSVNICSEDLLSPTIFGLKCDEKLECFISSNFRDVGKVMPVVFGEIKMSFWVREKAS